MRYLSICGLLAGMIGAGAAQPARTPDGTLWAGTTFSLRAIASIGNQPVHLSNEASVSVGAVIQWRVLQETPSAQTISGSEGWFTLLLTNRSNAVDSLALRLKSTESSDTSPWRFTLYEQREDGSGFTNGNLVTDATSPLMPGETRRLFLRANPPSDRNTDGAFLIWRGSSQRAPSVFAEHEFVVGMEASQGIHTSTTTSANLQIIGEPLLLHRRLYWLIWDGQTLRLHRTPNPLSAGVPFANNVSLEARISTTAPSHNTALVGDRWYFFTQSGRLMFFPLSQAQGGATIAAQPVSLPTGVVPELNLPLIRVGDSLCFVDRQNRIWLVHSVTHLFTLVPSFSTQPITTLSPLNANLFAVGRSNGRVDVYMDSVPVGQGLHVPYATNQPVRFIGLHESVLTVVAGNTLGVYRSDTAKWLWWHTLDSQAVAPPVCDLQTETCYILTASGQLYGFDLWNGDLAPLYPQQLFGEATVSRAALSCVARTDREVPYLYLQAQLSDGSVRTLLITARNPLNRFVNTQIPAGASIGTRWIITDTSAQGLAINWASSGAGNDRTRGALYGFPLR
ncbi:MAG: hypothetical protein NZM28_07915 [Fimbriimonadales bacterium]|nr:hypothetical protein [Fimbriimonadales bacterium]